MVWFLFGVLVGAGAMVAFGGIGFGKAITLPNGYSAWYINSLEQPPCKDNADCGLGGLCDKDRRACYLPCRWQSITVDQETNLIVGDRNAAGAHCEDKESHFADDIEKNGMRQDAEGAWEYFCCKVREDYWARLTASSNQ